MSPPLFTPNAALKVSPASGCSSSKRYPSSVGNHAAAREPTDAMFWMLTAPTMRPLALIA